MKLNKIELEALTTRIKDDIRNKAEADTISLNAKDDKANMAKAEEIKKTLTDLDKDTKKFLSVFSNNNLPDMLNLKKILKTLRTSKTKINSPDRYYHGPSPIFNDLVIAQIDSDNLDDLIKKVTDKYLP